MKRDKDREEFVSETAQGVIRVYGENALMQADLIVARMARHKTEQGTIIWKEVAKAVRKLQP